jgi:hypothetical protein
MIHNIHQKVVVQARAIHSSWNRFQVPKKNWLQQKDVSSAAVNKMRGGRKFGVEVSIIALTATWLYV